MRTIEVSAKTTELAIEKGLQMLGVEREQVKVNVLEKETMLKKAKVELVLFESEAEREAEENKAKSEKEIIKHIKEVRAEEQVFEERTELNETEEKIYKRLKGFFENLLNILNVEGKFDFKVLDNNLYFIIEGKELGVLIGHHGDTLNATQTLVNAIVKNEFEEYRKRVFVDIENYRSKRTDSLTALAKRMATKVVQVKKSLKLETMSSFERRIIHTALQGISNITTHSEGEEPNRCLVIDYVE